MILLESALRVLPVAAVVALLLAALRPARASHRYAAWKLVLCVALALPVLCRTTPRWHWTSPIAFADQPAETIPAVAIAAPGRTSGAKVESVEAVSTRPRGERPNAPIAWSTLLLSIYAAGLGWQIVGLARASLTTRRLARHLVTISDPVVESCLSSASRELRLPTLPRIAESPASVVPATFGFRRPVIALPPEWRNWRREQLKAVLIHEAAHIAHRDTTTLALSLVHRSIFWFSPFSWRLHRTLSKLAELSSDERVLATRVDPADYADILIHFYSQLSRAGRHHGWSIAMATRTAPHRRVRNILAWKDDCTMKTSCRPIAVILAISVPCVIAAASVQPVSARQVPGAFLLPSHDLTKVLTLPVAPALHEAVASVVSLTAEPAAPRAMARRPAQIDFSGRWLPRDPARNAAFFNVGLSTVTALGMTIRQDRDAITIASVESAETDTLRRLAPDARFASTYTFGADAVWQGTTLVVTEQTPGRTIRTEYSLDGVTLTAHTDFTFSTGRSNRVVLSYLRIDGGVWDSTAGSGATPTLQAAASDIWITVAPSKVPGGSGAVQARTSEMYVEGPSAGIGFKRPTAAGTEILWFTIKAWREADAARVVVYARLDDARAPGGFTETPISTFRIAPRQSIEVAEAERWGGPRLLVTAALR
jgi:beta-lactamase regulating signal transducer with metallopeptidase domain